MGYNNERYNSLKENHLCPQCGKPWDGKQVKCDACRKIDEDRRRKRRLDREAKGLCNRCGKAPAIRGTKYCKDCAEKAKMHKDSKETKKKRLIKYHEVYKPILSERREQYKAQGLCADCGKTKKVYGVVCEECYEKRQKVYWKFKLSDDCNGDCLNCTLPWCVDVYDKVKVDVTDEEKKRAREFDSEIRKEERRVKKKG